MCPEMVESKWKHYSSSDDAFIDSQDSAKARCSDCAKNPADPECCKYSFTQTSEHLNIIP